jgi:hypothetical protein
MKASVSVFSRMSAEVRSRTVTLKPSGLKLYLAGDDRITDIITSLLTPNFVVNTQMPEAGLDLQELIQQLVTARRQDGDLVTRNPGLYQEVVDVLCTASKGM